MNWSIDLFYQALVEAKNKIRAEENQKQENSQYSSLLDLGDEHQIYLGDNLSFLGEMSLKFQDEKNLEERPKLIYLDPPFYSKASYYNTIEVKGKRVKFLAYDDGKEFGFSQYIIYMYQVLKKVYNLLDEQGILALHLDWHSIHYMKLILDDIFGYNHLVNEIIWAYKSGGASKKSFSKKHDTILVYSKSNKYTFNPIKEKSYNRELKKYAFKGVEEFKDELGWYTMVNMKDVWNIDMVGRSSKERLGYATQKPEAILENLISAFTNEGERVWDLFLGSGTTLRVANRMKRKFTGCDMSKFSVFTAIKSCNFKNLSLWVHKNVDKEMGKYRPIELINQEPYIIFSSWKTIETSHKAYLKKLENSQFFYTAFEIGQDVNNLKLKMLTQLEDLNFEKDLIIFDIFGNYLKYTGSKK